MPVSAVGRDDLGAPPIGACVRAGGDTGPYDVLPITTVQTANTTPVLRDVRRAGKIFSYTVHGAFFFISEKEWGVHFWAGEDTGPYAVVGHMGCHLMSAKSPAP